MPRRRSGKKIDFLHWTVSGGSILAQASGTAAINLFAAQHLPETVMRTRGEVLAYLDGTQASGELVRLTMGIILVPEGTGTTVLWSPTTDGEAPWLWWDVFHLGYEEYVTDVVQAMQASSARRVVDSKAMRRNINMEQQFVVENSTQSGAAPVNVSITVRSLAGT